MRNLEKILAVKGKRFLLKVETSDKTDDYSKYEEIRNEIWRFPEDNLPGSRNLMCENYLHEGGALFIGIYKEKQQGGFAEDKTHLVGFSYGFVGVKDKAVAFKSLDNLWFYSQYLGIKEEFRGYDLGISAKEFQGQQVLDLFDISTIVCTYDPLAGVNAWRNVHHFGMDVLEYKVSTYGEYGGLLNRLDVPSDRFFMSWDLETKVQRPDYNLKLLLSQQRLPILTEDIAVQGQNDFLELEIIKDINLNLDHDFLLVQIPHNFYRMLRETDVDDAKVRQIPIDWRMATRSIFQELFKRGYRVMDFVQAGIDRKRNFYVLKK